MNSSLRLNLLPVLLLLAAHWASADPVLSDFQQINNTGVYLQSGLGAQQFLTGSLAPVYDLNSVTLLLDGPAFWGESANGPILYNAYLYSDSANKPASQDAFLGSFNFSDQTTSQMQVTFDPSATIQLDSATAYWIAVEAVTACPAGVLEGTSNQHNDISGTGWQYRTFGAFFTDGSFYPIPGSFTSMLQIDATAVPEPSLFLLLCAAAFAASRQVQRR